MGTQQDRSHKVADSSKIARLTTSESRMLRMYGVQSTGACNIRWSRQPLTSHG